MLNGLFNGIGYWTSLVSELHILGAKVVSNMKILSGFLYKYLI